MNIIKKTQHTRTERVGRTPDEITLVERNTWVVEFEIDDGCYLVSLDHDPTDAEVLQAYELGMATEVVSYEYLREHIRRQQEAIEILILSALEGA